MSVMQDFGALVTGIGVIVGGFFALYQYYKAQQWKKSEFAASILEKLSSDPELSMCCTFLDWSHRRLLVPEKYRVLTDEIAFTHNWATLVEALRSESERADFDFPLVFYRDAFDSFFTYLDRIDNYLSIGLFSINDVSSLAYWLSQLQNPRFANVTSDEPIAEPFMTFMKTYQYTGALNLMKRFRDNGLLRKSQMPTSKSFKENPKKLEN